MLDGGGAGVADTQPDSSAKGGKGKPAKGTAKKKPAAGGGS